MVVAVIRVTLRIRVAIGVAVVIMQKPPIDLNLQPDRLHVRPQSEQCDISSWTSAQDGFILSRASGLGCR